jgi:hypothetical protein
MHNLTPVLLSSALLFAGCATVSSSDNAGPEASAVSATERRADAQQTLAANLNTVAVYARGIVCPSCAIGIRVKLSSLDWVDRTRLNGGVKLNAKTQIVTIAIAEGKSVNRDTLTQAVRSAGFDPIELFWLHDGKLEQAGLKGK